MDLKTRRVVNDEYARSCLPPVDKREEPVRLNAAIKPLSDEPCRGEQRPAFVELDLNGHVNNTRYMDWCCNALGVDVLRDRRIVEFRVYYENEIRANAGVETELTLAGDQFAFFGFSEGKRCFAIGGRLEA